MPFREFAAEIVAQEFFFFFFVQSVFNDDRGDVEAVNVHAAIFPVDQLKAVVFRVIDEVFGQNVVMGANLLGRILFEVFVDGLPSVETSFSMPS